MSGRSSYRESEIDTCLLEVAVYGGTLRGAVRSLEAKREELGLRSVPDRRTLRDWMVRQHKERYEELKANLAPKIRQQISEQNAALAMKYAEMEFEAAEMTMDAARAGEIPARDMANVMRNFAVAKGVAVDKWDRVSDEGADARTLRTVDDILARLARRGLVEVIEGEAEEIEPPELTP